MAISLKKIARIDARIKDDQKLKQKSQLNSLEISFGALVIILSRIPSFPMSKIKNADAVDIIVKNESIIIIKIIADIVL